jgi:hypothetical protein
MGNDSGGIIGAKRALPTIVYLGSREYKEVPPPFFTGEYQICGNH